MSEALRLIILVLGSVVLLFIWPQYEQPYGSNPYQGNVLADPGDMDSQRKWARSASGRGRGEFADLGE